MCKFMSNTLYLLPSVCDKVKFKVPLLKFLDSNEISLELYNRLLQRLATNYHQIADDQKPDQGIKFVVFCAMIINIIITFSSQMCKGKQGNYDFNSISCSLVILFKYCKLSPIVFKVFIFVWG